MRSKSEVANTQRDDSISINEDSYDHESIDDSLEEQHIGGHMTKISDLKDDKQIVKSAA